MRRTDRLHELTRILRDGQKHRASELAARLSISVRSLYRDMETLQASGVPIIGKRGSGYRMRQGNHLPPITLTDRELEALNLGLAIVGEAADESLQDAAQSLITKFDAALSELAVDQTGTWKFATYPFASIARGVSHLPTLRAAIKARQKIQLSVQVSETSIESYVVRPLRIENWARVWALTGWCETTGSFRVDRVDLIVKAEALPEIFVDEPGKRLSDYRPSS